MDRLIAEHSIQRLIIDVNLAEDFLDFDLYKKCFPTDRKYVMDLTEHLPFMGSVEHTPESFWDQMLTTVPGFTATHHHLSPFRYDFENANYTKAVASGSQLVTYSIKADDGSVRELITKCFLSLDVEVLEGKWVVTRFKIQRDTPMQNLDLFAAATERVNQGKGRKCPIWGAL